MSVDRFEDIPARAVAVFAHPDDADVACAGTLARWVDAGCSVDLVICALGDKGSRDGRAKDGSLAARRAKEVLESAAIVGLNEVHQLGRKDGEFENDLELRAELVALLRTIRPEALVCPDPLAVFFGEHYYNHRDHRVVGFAALDAASPAAASPLYFPDSGRPHSVDYVLLSGSLDPNVSIEVTATIGRKVEAVACHRSQLGDSRDSMRTVIEERAAEAGRSVSAKFAESFRRVFLVH